MSTRSERRAARRNWPINSVDASIDDDIALAKSTTAEQRLGMMWRLAVDAWALTGEAIPQYERCDTPGKLLLPQ